MDMLGSVQRRRLRRMWLVTSANFIGEARRAGLALLAVCWLMATGYYWLILLATELATCCWLMATTDGYY